MKVALLVCMFVVAASAALPSVDRYMVPTGVARINNLIQRMRYAASGRAGRITGGAEVTPHSRPYQVGLFLTVPGGTAFCGGSLISSTYVLTAAHCVYDGSTTVSNFEIVLGAHSIRDSANTILQSKTSFVHPGWSPSTLQNDLALILLPTAVSVSDNIQPVNLPRYADAGSTFVGSDATASGWGLTSDTSTAISDNLNSVTTPVITNLSCNLRYLGVIQSTHICTNGADKKSTCSGDSGGPLTVVEAGRTIQVGIVSFGIALGCEVGWPPVFTRVTSYLDWISATAGVTITP